MYCTGCGHKAENASATRCAMCGAEMPVAASATGAGEAALGLVIPLKASPASVASYIVGLFSFILWPLGIVAIILGALALRRIKRTPGLKGTGRAITGIVLGSLTTALLVFVLILFVMDPGATP